MNEAVTHQSARDKFIDVLKSRRMMQPGEEWVIDANLRNHAHELAEKLRVHGHAEAAALIDPAPGPDNQPPTGQRPTDAELHARRAHPDFEYATTEGPRKQWDDADTPPADEEGDPDPSWERNVDAGRDGWDRFDYTEESYWRRRKQP